MKDFDGTSSEEAGIEALSNGSLACYGEGPNGSTGFKPSDSCFAGGFPRWHQQRAFTLGLGSRP